MLVTFYFDRCLFEAYYLNFHQMSFIIQNLLQSLFRSFCCILFFVCLLSKVLQLFDLKTLFQCFWVFASFNRFLLWNRLCFILNLIFVSLWPFGNFKWVTFWFFILTFVFLKTHFLLNFITDLILWGFYFCGFL